MNVDDESEEPLDPRIQAELEKLNKASMLINQLEVNVDEARTKFRFLLSESSQSLDALSKRLGSCIEKAKPYYESHTRAAEAQMLTQKAAARYERAIGMQAAAREMVELAEQGHESRKLTHLDSTSLEVLNHATIKVMAAESEKLDSEIEHKKISSAFFEAQEYANALLRDLKKHINKSRPYYEMKFHFHKSLDDQKIIIQRLENDIIAAKRMYTKALQRLETISNDIHCKRRSQGEALSQVETLGQRSEGVGAEHPEPVLADLMEYPPPVLADLTDASCFDEHNSPCTPAGKAASLLIVADAEALESPSATCDVILPHSFGIPQGLKPASAPLELQPLGAPLYSSRMLQPLGASHIGSPEERDDSPVYTGSTNESLTTLVACPVDVIDASMSNTTLNGLPFSVSADAVPEKPNSMSERVSGLSRLSLNSDTVPLSSVDSWPHGRAQTMDTAWQLRRRNFGTPRGTRENSSATSFILERSLDSAIGAHELRRAMEEASAAAAMTRVSKSRKSSLTHGTSYEQLSKTDVNAAVHRSSYDQLPPPLAHRSSYDQLPPPLAHLQRHYNQHRASVSDEDISPQLARMLETLLNSEDDSLV